MRHLRAKHRDKPENPCDFGRSAAIELPRPLRYTGTWFIQGGNRGGKSVVPAAAPPPGVAANALSFKDLPMSSTFDTVANIISETCDIPRETIKPESHAIDDLGIDSLDFLDVAFAVPQLGVDEILGVIQWVVGVSRRVRFRSRRRLF